MRRNGSGAGFVDHFFPNAFGLEDEFDEFACSAFAAIGFGGVVGGAAHFRGGVVDGDGEADALHDHQVREIIAEEGDFGLLRAGFAEDVFVGSDFVTLLFVDEFDVQLFAAAAKGGAAASGDDAGAQAGGHGQREALTVVSVKRFALEGRAVGLGQKRDAAVGQRAVHVHQQDHDLFRSSCQFRWDFLSSDGQWHVLFSFVDCKSRSFAAPGTFRAKTKRPATTSVLASTNREDAPHRVRRALRR
jgi:hypothetical protein